jgi:hypothetical protein
VIAVNTDVDISLSSCSTQDADVVFHALARHFRTEAGTTEPASRPAAGMPTVWSGRFDAHDVLRGEPASGNHPEHLDGQVVIRLSGTPYAVRQARAVFAADFATEDLGITLGDQEVEVSLRLS